MAGQRDLMRKLLLQPVGEALATETKSKLKSKLKAKATEKKRIGYIMATVPVAALYVKCQECV